MQFKIHILLIYLTVLTALPSVRAIKLQFGNKSEQTCENSAQNKCVTGKFIMLLNFTPLQIIKAHNFYIKAVFFDVELQRASSFYKVFLISNYLTSIWHPPKYY